MKEEVSLKDLFADTNYIKGKIDALTKAASQTWENEKRIIKLEQNHLIYDKQFAGYDNQIKEIKDEIKQENKTNQKILVAIGIAAILASIFGQPLLEKLIS